MIPDFLKTKAQLFGGTFTLADTSAVDVTFAFAPGTNQGVFHAALADYATANRPGFMNTFAIGGPGGSPISSYDELMVIVSNASTDGTGFPVALQFGWRGYPNDITTAYETPGYNEASALTAGALNTLGTAASVRRYPASIAEFGPIEINGGRVFRFPVAGPLFAVGAACVGGAASVKQAVLIHVVPRTIGVARAGL